MNLEYITATVTWLSVMVQTVGGSVPSGWCEVREPSRGPGRAKAASVIAPYLEPGWWLWLRFHVVSLYGTGETALCATKPPGCEMTLVAFGLAKI